MRTVEEVRRLRLAELLKEVGSYAALNELLDRERRDSGLSQIANGSKNSRGGQPKVMGSDVARRLEEVCKKELGWMDTDPDAFWPFGFSAERWRHLNERERGMVERVALTEIERLEAERSSSPGKQEPRAA